MTFTRSVGRIGLATMLAVVSLACSSENLGNSGAGGQGGTGSASLELPNCLRDLMAPCAPVGMCVSDSAGGQICYASGARASTSPLNEPLACDHIGTSAQVNKADGTLCYTFESYAELTPGRCIAHRYTWKDAAGNVVATGMDDTDVDGTSELVMNISCTATSEVSACQQPTLPPRPDRCCGLSLFGGAVCAGGVLEPSCEAGTCP